MMGDRSHLIRKSAVDVNGRHTTVLVRPGIQQGFARERVLSMAPRASATYMETMAPTPMHRAQLALIAEADYELREKMAADVYRAPAALEILGSDPDPIVRNIVSANPSANAKALSNVVTQESNPFNAASDLSDEYHEDTMLNVALHGNVDYSTLEAVYRAERGEQSAGIAYARMNGEWAADPRISRAA